MRSGAFTEKSRPFDSRKSRCRSILQAKMLKRLSDPPVAENMKEKELSAVYDSLLEDFMPAGTLDRPISSGATYFWRCRRTTYSINAADQRLI